MSQMKIKKWNQSSVIIRNEYRAYDNFYEDVEYTIQGLNFFSKMAHF